MNNFALTPSFLGQSLSSSTNQTAFQQSIQSPYLLYQPSRMKNALQTDVYTPLFAGKSGKGNNTKMIQAATKEAERLIKEHGTDGDAIKEGVVDFLKRRSDINDKSARHLGSLATSIITGARTAIQAASISIEQVPREAANLARFEEEQRLDKKMKKNKDKE